MIAPHVWTVFTTGEAGTMATDLVVESKRIAERLARSRCSLGDI